MTVLAELATYIDSNSTHFRNGASTGSAVPIWMSGFPDQSPGNAIALFEAGGPGPVYTQGGSIYVERPSIQVISRSTSYVTARGNAERVYRLLSVVKNASIAKTTSTGNTTYVTVTPIQSPFTMGKDAEERNLISCNYIAEKVLS